jgi:hypothetical protein
MTLCEDGHGEVCFDGRKCPACEAINDLTRQKDKEIEGLNDEVKSLHERITELENK